MLNVIPQSSLLKHLFNFFLHLIQFLNGFYNISLTHTQGTGAPQSQQHSMTGTEDQRE